MKIILASSSFMKTFIMNRSHLMYSSDSPDVDEHQFDDEPINKRVMLIAKAKAERVVARHPDAFVIAADTLTCDANTGAIYGKPENLETRYQQALDMSGTVVENHTGCSIFYKGKELETAHTVSTLTYQEFDKATYDRLTLDDNPERRSSVLGMFTDAAGFTLLESVQGSYTGAMGLPMEVVYRNLRKAKN